MKKNFRTLIATFMTGGLLLGAAATASAEPATADTTAPANLALLGPDRSMRAPQRAVKAPVRQTQERRETVVTPPAPPVKPFVYEKTECKTLTDAPRDINGEVWLCLDGPTFYSFDEGRVRLWTPNGDQPINKLGAMGADREFLNLEYCQRLGVWANGRIADKSPQAMVGDMVSRIKAITCGTWSKPMADNIAGVPVTRAYGYDEFGNYYYEVIALERFGNKYAFATRIPYKTRYSVHRNTELAWMVTHIHPTSWSE
jgi:hypothetical protein